MWQDPLVPKDIRWDPRQEQRLKHVRARVEHGLRQFKDWPSQTPARIGMHHAAAMVTAAMETVEKAGDCGHQVLLLGAGKPRLNAMLAYRTGETREETQRHKLVTWVTMAKLFNLLDADVSLWLSDTWMASISNEEAEAGWEHWPSEHPNRVEALTLDVVTPLGGRLVLCKYDRTDTGIRWGMFEGAKHEPGMLFTETFGHLIKEHEHLRPVVADGQHRGRAPIHSGSQVAEVLQALRDLGHFVAGVDERYMRMN